MRNMGNMNKLMKQVQKMQKDMMKLQEELQERRWKLLPVAELSK